MADCAPHDTCSPDECFTAKLRYWRENGAPGVHFQGGRNFFNGTTIKTEQDRIKAQAKAKGNPEPVPYHSVYGS